MVAPKLTSFRIALQAEHIKKKGTGIYLMSAAIGTLLPVMTLLVVIYRNIQQAKPFVYSFYMNFIVESTIPFAGFFFPLLIIVLTSRITQLDHRNGGWRLMELQPISKSVIYFSKFSIVLISIAIAVLSLILSGLCMGWLAILITGLPINAHTDIPFILLAQWATRLFVASLYIAALQYAIAVLVRGYIWSILIGFVGLIGGSLLKAQGFNLDWYPYHILSRITDYPGGSDLGYWFTYTDWVSLIAALILLYIGKQWYHHKTLKRAFVSKPARALSLVAVLICGGGILTYLWVPKKSTPHTDTVLAGSIDTPFPLQTLYVIHPVLHDTLATIPIAANKFHYRFSTDIAADYYVLGFDHYFGKQVYFGQSDSVYIKGRANEQTNELKITGTRLAENQLPLPGQHASLLDHYLQNNMYLDNPNRFGTIIYDEWKKASRGYKHFKTTDGYTYRDDFKDRLNKLLAVQYLNYWDAYETKRQAAFPDDETLTTPQIQEIKDLVSLNEELLLGSELYMEYVVNHLVATNQTDIAQDIKALEEISKLPAGDFKDKLFYWQLNKSLNNTTDGTERTTLVQEYAHMISTMHLKDRLIHMYNRLQHLNRGEYAPDFSATDLADNAVSLADLNGQYVLIDVWATWCAPCKKQSPLFEKLAIKYKDLPIRFVALSVDSDESKWRIDAKNKSKSVLQWRVLANENFGRDYAASVIPQFIFIDPDGRFVHSKMPLPSESAFEILLRNELGLPD